MQFFAPIKPVAVRIKYEPSGRSSGEADAMFASHDDALRAMKKDKEKIRKCALFSMNFRIVSFFPLRFPKSILVLSNLLNKAVISFRSSVALFITISKIHECSMLAFAIYFWTLVK